MGSHVVAKTDVSTVEKRSTDSRSARRQMLEGQPEKQGPRLIEAADGKQLAGRRPRDRAHADRAGARAAVLGEVLTVRGV